MVTLLSKAKALPYVLVEKLYPFLLIITQLKKAFIRILNIHPPPTPSHKGRGIIREVLITLHIKGGELSKNINFF